MSDLSALRAIEAGVLTDDEKVALAALLTTLRDPRPIRGLSPSEGQIVRALQSAQGAYLPAERLAQIACPEAGPEQARVLLYRIGRKRPDLASRIVNRWGAGYAWVDVT